MNRFPSLADIEVAIATGKYGIAVIVEGDTFADDPFYYHQWFETHSREIAFFPQNGWAQVKAAVATLRQRLFDVPVYGLIDRDFCEDHELDKDFDTLGILRTPSFTLENYLLDPECWAATFQLVFSRNLAAANGWEQPAFVEQQINAAFQACCGIAPHNWVIQTISPRYEGQPGFQSRKFLAHYKAYTGDDSMSVALLGWQAQLNASENLSEMFQTRLSLLRSQAAATHTKQVSGWYVLQYLRDKFPRGKVTFPLDHYLNLYLDRCSSPPLELAALIDRILIHAREQKGT